MAEVSMVVKEPYQLTEYGRKLAAENTGLAYSRAMPDRPGRLDRDERISVALEALVRAVVYFDPNFGGAFSTYAVCSIERAIVRASYTERVIRIGPYAFAAGRSAGERERAERLLATSSLDALDHEPAAPEPDDEGDERDRIERSARLRAAIARMGGRRARVLTARLAGRTLRSIGAELGVTKERVRQVEMEARRTIRAMLGEGDVMLKLCPGCGLYLDPVRFYRTRTGLSDRCQSCDRAESGQEARAGRRRLRAARRRARKPAAADPDPAAIAEVARRIDEARRARAEGEGGKPERKGPKCKP